MQSLLGEKQFFFVWWMIRDLLLDRPTNMDDVDISMWGNHADIKSLILHSRQKKLFSFFDTEKYGTMTVIPKEEEFLDTSCKTLGTNNKELGTQVQYEITPFRTETTYSDGRHPDEVVRSDSLLLDSQRRDFTINSIYYCKLATSPSFPLPVGEGWPSLTGDESQPILDDKKIFDSLEKQWWFFDQSSQTLIVQNHELITELLVWDIKKKLATIQQFLTIFNNVQQLIFDPHHGLQDLLNKKVRAVWLPDQRFQEDSLRLIRALRFAIALECDLHKDTRNSLKKNAYLIRQVAKERIKQELDKVFKGNNPFGFVALLDEANMLKWIFPKLYDNKNVNQPVRYHPFDVYTHSMMVLYHMQRLSDDYLLRYAALYHDVGKVEQYSSYAMNLDTEWLREIFSSWLNHPVCGAEFMRTDFRDLGFSNKELDMLERYVRRHMKPGEILNGDLNNQRKKTRKLIAEVGPEMTKNLCILTIADRLGQYNPLQAPELDSVYGMINLIDTLMAEEGRFTLQQLVVDGNRLMTNLNLTPGPKVGVLLTEIFERVSDNIPERNNETVIYDWIKQKKIVER